MVGLIGNGRERVSAFIKNKAAPAVKGIVYRFFAPYAMGLKLIFGGREESTALGYHTISMCLVAGVIMAVAKPLAFFVTGWNNMTKLGDVYYADTNNNSELDSGEPQVPVALVDMVGRVFDIVFYIGVVVLVLGLILAGIRLVWRRRKS